MIFSIFIGKKLLRYTKAEPLEGFKCDKYLGRKGFGKDLRWWDMFWNIFHARLYVFGLNRL